MKEARPKKRELYPIWVHYYKTLGNAIDSNGKLISDCLRIRNGEGWEEKEQSQEEIYGAEGIYSVSLLWWFQCWSYT